jgi:hypothetical protein
MKSARRYELLLQLMEGLDQWHMRLAANFDEDFNFTSHVGPATFGLRTRFGSSSSARKRPTSVESGSRLKESSSRTPRAWLILSKFSVLILPPASSRITVCRETPARSATSVTCSRRRRRQVAASWPIRLKALSTAGGVTKAAMTPLK